MSDIFSEVDQPSIPENPFEELVGEGKKFSDAQALAKAKWESDQFISQLERENAELRQAVSKQQTVEEIMTQIKSMQGQAPQTPQGQPSAEPEKPEDKEDIHELFQKLYAAKQVEENLSKNRRTVQETLEKVWGSEAKAKLQETARNLGVSIDYLRKLGEDSPQLLFQAVGVRPDTSSRPAPAAPVNRGVQAPVGPVERTKSYYEKLKATNPVEYFSAKTQQAMYKDAMRLGDSFYDA